MAPPVIDDYSPFEVSMWLALVFACRPGPGPSAPLGSAPAPPGTPAPTTPVMTTVPTTPIVACETEPITGFAPWPAANPASPSASAALGPSLSVVGDPTPGASLVVSWPAADGTAVDWYVGDDVGEDCGAVVGDGCLWVAGTLADRTVAAGGVAATTVTVDPKLLAGEAVVVQGVADDGTVSPLWVGVFDAAVAGSDPFTSPRVFGDGTLGQVFPGTWRGLLLSGTLNSESMLRTDAGERLTVTMTWPEIPKDDDWEVNLNVYGFEVGTGEFLSWTVFEQTATLTSEASQWTSVGVWTGFYEPIDTTYDLLLELAPPSVEATWYADLDADGYGDAPLVALTRPSFASDVTGDCDDADADRNPGALEVCGDGRDADCDGRDDCATVFEAPGPAAIAIVPPQGEWAWAHAAGDLTGDGAADLLVGGRLLAGPFSADVDLEGATVAMLGYHATGAGDLDGDRQEDLFSIGSDNAIHVVLGPFVDQIDAYTCGTPISSSVGDASYTFVPQRAGDTDGDGLAEILAVGLLDVGGEQASGVTLYRAPFDVARTDRDADVRIQLGEPGGGWTNSLIANSADVDGDGLDDLVILDTFSDGLTVHHAPLPPEIVTPAPDRVVDAGTSDRGLAVGDFDGDGAPDFAYATDYLGTTATVEIVSDLKGAPFATVTWDGGVPDGHRAFPWDEMANAGDLDSNGVSDLILSSGYEDRGDAVWLAGPLTGASDPYVAGTWSAGTWWIGPGGDLTGDGVPDLLALGTPAPGEAPVGFPTFLLTGI